MLDGSIGLAPAVHVGAVAIKVEGSLLFAVVRDQFLANDGNETQIYRRPVLGGVLGLGLFFDPLP
jgi:hypothetical protein